jgi:hypothetical protein
MCAIRALTDGAGVAELDAARKSATELRGRLCESDYDGFDERMSRWIREHNLQGIVWEPHASEIGDRLADVILENWNPPITSRPTLAAYRVAYHKMRFVCGDLNASRAVRDSLLPAAGDDLTELEQGGLQCFLMTKRWEDANPRETFLRHVSEVPTVDLHAANLWHLALRSGQPIPSEVAAALIETIDEAELPAGDDDDDQDAASGGRQAENSVPAIAAAVFSDAVSPAVHDAHSQETQTRQQIEWSKPLFYKDVAADVGPVSHNKLKDMLVEGTARVPGKIRYQKSGPNARKIQVAIADLPAKTQAKYRPNS